MASQHVKHLHYVSGTAKMRASEFIRESTCSGSIATVAVPMGGVIKRIEPPKPGKYANSLHKIRKKHNSK